MASGHGITRRKALLQPYDLVKRGYFETTLIDRRIRIITSSFEAWYQKQTHYVKISERSNENGIYREA